MKKLLFVIAFACTGHLLLAQSSTPEPVLYYQLNGNAKEANYADYNGKIYGNVTPVADRFGNPNGAMFFPGTTDSYIKIRSSAVDQSSNISISVWINISSQNALSSFIDKALPCTNDSWHVGTENNHFSAWVSNSLTCGDVVQLTAPLTVGAWKHIVFVVDATANIRKLYINGVLAASGSYTASIPYSNYPLILGAAIENDAPAFPFHGAMDNLRIYNRVLTDAQVLDLYNNIETCNHIDDDEDGLVDETCTPVLSIGNRGMFEGNADTALLQFTVTLSNIYEDTISVKCRTTDKTATAGVDYIAVQRNIVFAPGEFRKHINVPIIGDILPESPEQFVLHFYKPVHLTLPLMDSALGTIYNDDAFTVAAGNESNATKNGTVQLTPNPAKHFITVIGIAAKTGIEITDMRGSIVHKQYISNNTAIDISKLLPGIYMLRYKEGNAYKSVKFVKE